MQVQGLAGLQPLWRERSIEALKPIGVGELSQIWKR
jgi:hypothetical protein